MRIVDSSYMIPAGDEFYQCERVVAQSDLYILGFTPVSPMGVHHELFAIDPSGTAPGKTTCGPIGNNWQILFASGINSPSLRLPTGVVLKVNAGDTLVLNLHLFNATGSPISASAGLDVLVTSDPGSYQIAGVPLIGPLSFTIGASRVVSGACTMPKATNFFAVFPHMHQSGSHIKVWADQGATQTVVWDDPYSFMDQKFAIYPDWHGPPEIALAPGDHIRVECTYDATGVGKHFGDSTLDEMCFAISYVYPAIPTTLGTPYCLN
jgi:hypothetical protein